MKHLIKKADLLTEQMLPYVQKFKDKLIVVKYGGNAMKNDELKRGVIKDIALLFGIGIKIVVVHGGGPNISEEMKKAGIEPKFVHGLRVSDETTVKIAEKISKEINHEICSLLGEYNTKAEEECSSLFAKQKNEELGFVGEVIQVDKNKILAKIKEGAIPVISPLGISKDNKTKFNINADSAAVAVAKSLKAEKLTLLTDVDGVMNEGKLISHLTINQVHEKIKHKIITAGMIPKVLACAEAVEGGCKKAHLINGTIMHSLLFEIFTDAGVGTEIVKNGSI